MKPAWQTLALILAWAAACVPLARGAVFFVAPDGTGDFPTIQAAVDAAQPGDIVELGDGVFSGAGNRDIDYRAKSITIRSRSDDPTACTIDCGGSGGELHRGFHIHGTPAARLRGVTIRDGNMNAMQGSGGAIQCLGASATIENVIAEENWGEGGSGLRCSYGGPVAVAGCLFRNNTGGPAISTYGCALTVTATACENHPAGGLSAGDADVVLDRCAFRANHAEVNGGGLAVAGGSVSATDCTFECNQCDAIAMPRSGGGGACVSGAAAVFERCHFIGNRVRFESPFGFGGGLYARESNVAVRSCSFRDNQALYGGGAGLDGCDPSLEQCSLTGNQAPYGGGALCLRDASPSVTHTIMAFNLNGDAVWCLMSTETPELTCCDIYGNAGGDWIGCIEGQQSGPGNLCLDPLFCDLAAGILNLMPESPCAPLSPWNPECGLIGAFPVGCDPQSIAALEPAPASPHLTAQPNPLRGVTRLAFRVLPARAGERVRLSIHDLTGRCVRTLADGALPAGDPAWVWRGDDDRGGALPAGVYFGRLTLNGQPATRALLLVR